MARRSPHPEARTLKAWNGFRRLLAGGDAQGLILESWRRSRQAGVAADAPAAPPPRVSSAELERRRAANDGLIEVAHRHLRWLHAAFRAIPHVVYLVDADGVVLDALSSDRRAARRWGLEPGYDWSEKTMGTNGAGTAVAGGQPAVVVGPDHYRRTLRGFT